jgi:hypothetical protein
MSEVATATTTAEQTAAELAEVKAALHKTIVARFNNLVDVKEFKFSFKTDKETSFKRPTVELALPVLSVEGIVDILQNGEERPKELELLLEVLSDAIYAQARTIVNDDEKISQDNFPLDKVNWAFIANMPKAERRGGGIAKETWDEFSADYLAVMPQATGKSAEQVGLAAKLMVKRFADVKTQKPVIQKLLDQLGIYATNSPNAEQYTEVIEFLTKKGEALLNISEEELLAAL